MAVGRSTEVYAYLLLTRLRRRLIGTFFVGINCDLCSRSSSCDNPREPAVQPEQSDAAGGTGTPSNATILLILDSTVIITKQKRTKVIDTGICTKQIFQN